MNLNTRLTQLAEQLDAHQLNQLSDKEWLMLTQDDLALQMTRTRVGIVLACCPYDCELDPRWTPLLLTYNGLLINTDGMVMGLTAEKRLIMQLLIVAGDSDELANLAHRFLQLVREWHATLTQTRLPITPDTHTLTMMSTIKG